MKLVAMLGLTLIIALVLMGALVHSPPEAFPP
jgi:hypothetical protein